MFALKTPMRSARLLRISYNFADGAKSLLTLVVGLSDLKPLLFWLTVLEQSQLAERFADWGLSDLVCKWPWRWLVQ